MEEINIPLNKQVQIYSFETNALYSEEEYQIDFELNNLRRNSMLLSKELEIINKYKKGELSRDSTIKRIFKLNNFFAGYSSVDEYHYMSEEEKIRNVLDGVKNKKKHEQPFDILYIDNENIVKELEEEMKVVKESMKDKIDYLVDTMNKCCETRYIRSSYLNPKNIISIFDSSLTRTLGMEYDKLNSSLIIIGVYYFKIAEDIVLNGFICNGEKYIYLTSSAGQIRQKKMVFIKESLWQQHKNTLLCGLSIEKINSKGGINRNKYLAYLALCNSATDIWEGFDMTKAIVVDDFETNVNGEVDFFDDKTYIISRQIMDVPITHNDGCGIMLPSVSDKNRIFRAPWIKGLLSPFEFVEFVKLNKGSTKINDIYGKEYDIINDDIKIIFTKSQFKMWKYYDSWQEYIDYYKQYNCTAGYCNEEPDFIGNARLNYQMLQTLTDISNDELVALADKTNNKIKNISSDLDTVMEVFKANKINENSTYLQQAINLYPELLEDIYTKEKLKLLKASIVKDARAGKLSLNSKYTFILPDLYAFCEYLFLGNKHPNGLLNNGEVYCSLFPYDRELDCLRSPHLYKEHALRENVCYESCKKWFITKGLYVSSFDLISKLIMNDWDGDQSLVCSDKLFIDIAKRNMNNIVPLYYNMAQAQADIIDNNKIFEGLKLAFTSSNIGSPSNDITKVYNYEEIDLDLVKILTAEVNFTIDYAKTLYKPKRPKWINSKINRALKSKIPHFFRFAKDKSKLQVEPLNNSTVNRLYYIIKPGRIKFNFDNCDFDYRMLMKNPNIDINVYDKICKVYDLFKSTTYNTSANTDKAIEKRTANFRHKREQFVEYFKDINIVTDVLIKYLYQDGKNSKYKDVLWYCLGDVLIENLKYNLNNKYYDCNKCGKKYYAEYYNQKLCKKCSTVVTKSVKIFVCVDCGENFKASNKANNVLRCQICRRIKQLEYQRESMRKKRNVKLSNE